jgi:hypothetical protein
VTGERHHNELVEFNGPDVGNHLMKDLIIDWDPRRGDRGANVRLGQDWLSLQKEPAERIKKA